MNFKNILITGGTGFIGSHLKTALKDKYNILVPNREDLNLINEISVKEFFSRNQIDCIIHAAFSGARIIPNESEKIIQNNVNMIKNILKYRSDQCKIINLGSGAEYDKNRDLVKVSEYEFGQFIPKTPYGYSKYLISNILNKENNTINLRIFGVYGEGENKTRFPSDVISQVLEKNEIIINQNAIFDYIYIDDLCNIIEYFIENNTINKNINVTPDKSIQLLEIAKIIKTIYKANINIKILNKKMNFQYTGNNAILRSEIKNLKFSDYETSLKSLLNYIKREPNK